MNKMTTLQKLKAIFITLVISLLLPVAVFANDGQNLITNNSFETANEIGDMPASWTTAGWGVNVKYFNYLSSGAFDGNKSVGITLAEVLDENGVPVTLTGDAKLLPEEVSVTAGSNYIYTDYYKSDVSSRVVVRYNKGTCVTTDVGCTYDQLAVLPAASDWTKFQIQFNAPEEVVSVNIFHLIESVGTLELDAVSLEKAVELVITDMVPNNSVEQSATGLTPLAWYAGNWGDNSPVFEYITNEGQEGTRSVKVTLENHVSGDAKWYFEPQAVEVGEDYKFTAWYKSNVVPYAVVQFIKSDNSVSYLGLQRPQPQGENWQKYESEFSVPSGVVKATVFFFIDTVGYVQTDNYHIAPYTYEGFDRALVSITFDDGAESNHVTVLPFVNSLDIKTTHCYATEYVEGDEVQIQRVKDFYNAGHEICSHTVSHPDLTTVDSTQLNYQLTHSKEYLESVIGVPVPNFASPFGAYNETVNNRIKDIYSSHRTVDEGYNSQDNLDKYRLKVQNMKPTTTLTEFKEWVNKAIADKTWLILVYHDVNTQEAGVTPYGTYTPDFEEQMTWLAGTGVTVKTYQAALDEVTGVVPVCPVGTTLNGNDCEPIVCATGTILVGSTCEPIICDVGSALNGNTCEPIVCSTGTILVGSTCEPIVCAAGTTLVGNTCEPIVCSVGTTLVGNNCEPIICSTGTTLVGNTCEQIVCSTGTTLVGSTCEPIVCASGSSLVGNTCVANPIVCPPDNTLILNVCVPNPKRNNGGGGGKPRVVVPVIVAPTTTVPDLGVVLGASTTTENNNSGKYIFTRNLKVGMFGQDVSELQKRLALEGLYTGPITNYYGVLTETAVKAYQSKYGIPATGLVGQMTLTKLNGTNVPKPVSKPAPTPAPATTQNDLIAALQKQLKELQAQLAALQGL